MRRWLACVAGLWLAILVSGQGQEAYQWTLPARFPVPTVPADNPMSEAKVTLGRHLFYDTRLSGNGTQSCGSCHEQARAFTCHGGVHFSGAMGSGRRMQPIELHNTGLYNLAGTLSYPPANPGLYAITREPKDVGKFKAPTLRNIAATAPYVHDGSVATLEGALDHYAAGGRTIAEGVYRGVGHDNVNKSQGVRGFALTAAQRADLLAFLRSLTDDALLRDPRFADPWVSARTP